DPQTDQQAASPTPEERFGLHVVLDGGEEGTIDRPNKLYRSRTAQVCRETGETAGEPPLHPHGTGEGSAGTAVGLFRHTRTLLSRHSLIDLEVKAGGDLHVDAHHTVEDVGLCYGRALAEALGNKAGIRRYGSVTLPMDEVLVTAAIDLSGRPCCVWR